MSEAEDIEIIKKRSIKGVVALTSRTFLLQIVALAATFLLTIFLKPSEYGVFFVVTAAVNFLVYFSDIGLAAALIQKKEEITSDDLRTTFTIQQALVVTLVTLSLLFSTFIANFYNLNSNGLWLLRALIISFLFSSLKTVPSILLERKLQFEKLIIPGIVENLFFYISAVYLAWKGWGINSFTVAVLLRGVSGLIVLYLLAPWTPVLGIHAKSAKKLLSFGIPFQLNSFIALIKDDLLTVFLGKVLTFSQIGYIGWGQKWAFFPLRFFMDSINRVTFPAYSRIQEKKELLGKAVEKSMYFISVTVFPVLTGLFLAGPFFIEFFPKYQKWQPALVSLTFFCVNAIFSSVSTTLTNVLNATGKIKTTLKLMVFWTGATWIITLISLKLIGYNGVAVASAIVAATSWITVILVRRVIYFRFWDNIKDALLATVVMALVFTFVGRGFINNLISLFIVVTIHLLIYILGLLLFGRKKLKLAIKIIC